MPITPLQLLPNASAKSKSGPMTLAAFWAKQAAGTLRIRVTEVTRNLPPRPFNTGRERKPR